MANILHITGTISLILYISASISFLLQELGKVKGRFSYRAVFWGWITHSLSLISLGLFNELHIFLNSADYLSILAWGLVTLFLFMVKGREVKGIGMYLAPLATVLMFVSAILMHTEMPKPFSTNPTDPIFLSFHVLPAILAEVCLVLSLIVGGIFLINERKLKNKMVDIAFLSGPSLDGLDRILSRLALIGASSMTVALVSGYFWNISRGICILSLDARQWSGIILWIIFVCLVIFRELLKFSRKRLAVFLCMGATFFLVPFISFLISTGRIWHGMP